MISKLLRRTFPPNTPIHIFYRKLNNVDKINEIGDAFTKQTHLQFPQIGGKYFNIEILYFMAFK